VTFKHFLGDQPMINRIFNIGPFPMSGSHTTINSTSYSFNDPYNFFVGPSMRMIIDMANPSKAEVINPPGQVGHPFSKHYRDQAEFWVRGLYITLETDTTLIRHSNFELLELTTPSEN
jgi:penicillin amidase